MGTDPFEDMTDNQVIEKARQVYAWFQQSPRWHADNDKRLREWGAVCHEMGRRGITDTVTEGGSVVVFGPRG